MIHKMVDISMEGAVQCIIRSRMAGTVVDPMQGFVPGLQATQDLQWSIGNTQDSVSRCKIAEFSVRIHDGEVCFNTFVLSF